MKQIKSLLSVFVLTLAATACAGNSGENKKSNEPTKEDNKMEVVALNKADFLNKVDIYQIDVDKEQELAAAFGIRSIPTLLMIPMKEEPRIMQGAMPKDQLKKAIDEFLLKQNNEAKQ